MSYQEDKQSKATSFLFPIEMIVKLEWIQSNTQNIEQYMELDLFPSHVRQNFHEATFLDKLHNAT